MKRRPVDSTSRSGFTLIELLIVVSLIAILAGMIFPAANDMLTRAKGVKCSNNLRQIGIAANAASNDNDNTYPIIEIDATNTPVADTLGVPARNLDVALLPYGITPVMLQCPIDMMKGTQSDYNTRNPHSSYMWMATAEDTSSATPVIISRRRGQVTVPPSRLQLASDWEAVHRPDNINMSATMAAPMMMYVLYGDGHVRTGVKTTIRH
jgi:prepilin-type N-terminal cleavage/methylation domain-containing protein